MSETYTSTFAGAGKARHRSWIMMVDMPGSKGYTCKVGEWCSVQQLHVASAHHP